MSSYSSFVSYQINNKQYTHQWELTIKLYFVAKVSRVFYQIYYNLEVCDECRLIFSKLHVRFLFAFFTQWMYSHSLPPSQYTRNVLLAVGLACIIPLFMYGRSHMQRDANQSDSTVVNTDAHVQNI